MAECPCGTNSPSLDLDGRHKNCKVAMDHATVQLPLRSTGNAFQRVSLNVTDKQAWILIQPGQTWSGLAWPGQGTSLAVAKPEAWPGPTIGEKIT